MPLTDAVVVRNHQQSWHVHRPGPPCLAFTGGGNHYCARAVHSCSLACQQPSHVFLALQHTVITVVIVNHYHVWHDMLLMPTGTLGLPLQGHAAQLSWYNQPAPVVPLSPPFQLSCTSCCILLDSFLSFSRSAMSGVAHQVKTADLLAQAG